MDSEAFAARIEQEFGCDGDTAETIAERAAEYHREMGTDRPAEEQVGFMRDSGKDRAVAAWNWAVGYVDPTHWDEGNPYKLEP